MNVQKHQDQGINVLSQTDYLPILISSFLIDRQSQGFADETVEFYRKKLKYFLHFCDGQTVTQISQITPNLVRRYILELQDSHNDGGVHACFRRIWLSGESRHVVEPALGTRSQYALCQTGSRR